VFLVFREIGGEPPSKLHLTADEIRHLRARRLRPGDELFLGDGRSRRWRGELGPDGSSLILPKNAPFYQREERAIYLCSAVPSGKRWDILLQKATELGMTHLIPMKGKRSERVEFSKERMDRIVMEAAAQSRRFFLPCIFPLCTVSDIPGLLPEGTEIFFLDPDASSRPLSTFGIPAGPIAVVAGPEGGFAKEEIKFAKEAGWHAASLGDNVLRVETASIAALAYFLIAGAGR